MGVVDVDRGAAGGHRGALHPTGRLLKAFDGGDGVLRIGAGRDRDRGGGQRVFRLEGGEMIEPNARRPGRMDDIEDEAKTIRRQAAQIQKVAALAVAADDLAGGPRRGCDAVCDLRGRGNGREAPAGHDFREKTLLRREIGGFVAVVIEMIAAEGRKDANLGADSVETALVQAVTGRFDRGGGDAGAGQLRQRGHQFHRVGRRQPAIAYDVRADDAQRADAGGGPAKRRPDLTRELRRRRLAAGAGDQRDDRRAHTVERRREFGEPTARIVHLDHLDPVAPRLHARPHVRQDGDGALRDRLVNIVASVGRAALKRDEEAAADDFPAVGRQTGEATDVLCRAHESSLPRLRIARMGFERAGASLASGGMPTTGAARSMMRLTAGAATQPPVA